MPRVLRVEQRCDGGGTGLHCHRERLVGVGDGEHHLPRGAGVRLAAQQRDGVGEAAGRLVGRLSLADLRVTLGQEIAIALDPEQPRRLRRAHLQWFGDPTEHRTIEARRPVGIGCVQLAEIPRAGSVDELRPAGVRPLPQPEPGAPRIGAHRHAPGARDIGRRCQHPAAVGLHQSGGGVSGRHGDVGRPVAALGLARRWSADAAHRQPVEAGVGVARRGFGRRAQLVGPAEKVAVERHRPVGIGLHDVDPARHSHRVAISCQHVVSFSSLAHSVQHALRNRSPCGRFTTGVGGGASQVV